MSSPFFIVFNKKEIVFARTSPQHKLEIGLFKPSFVYQLIHLMYPLQSNTHRRLVILLECKLSIIFVFFSSFILFTEPVMVSMTPRL